MGRKKIIKALNNKNIEPIHVIYERGVPTPYGYTNGWSLKFSEKDEDNVFDLDPSVMFQANMEFDTLSEVLNWVDSLPITKE